MVLICFHHSTLRQLPLTGHISAPHFGSKVDESKCGMLWKEPAATWFYGLLEDIVIGKDAPGNNIPTTVHEPVQM